MNRSDKRKQARQVARANKNKEQKQQAELRQSRRRGNLQGPNVMIVTPCPLNYNVDLRTAVFCASAIARGIAAWLPTPSRSAEDGRNQIFRETLAMTDVRYTHFFLLDADSFPYEPYMIENLLSHGLSVVGGPTPTQREGKEKWDLSGFRHATVVRDKIQRLWNVVIETDNVRKILKRSFDPKKDELPAKMFKAKYVGGTGLLIDREVIEKMPIPYQKTERNEHGKTTLSEDYYFCEQITKLGYPIWIDPTLKSGHNNSIDIGNY